MTRRPRKYRAGLRQVHRVAQGPTVEGEMSTTTFVLVVAVSFLLPFVVILVSV